MKTPFGDVRSHETAARYFAQAAADDVKRAEKEPPLSARRTVGSAAVFASIANAHATLALVETVARLEAKP